MENREIEAIVREVLKAAGGSLGNLQFRPEAAPLRNGAASGHPGESLQPQSEAYPARKGAVPGHPGESPQPRPEAYPARNGAASGHPAESPQFCPGAGTLAAANGGLVPVTMPLALALKLIESVEAKAAEWGMRVVTAVSDAAARPVAVHCMDGAYIGSFDVALNKTYTSIAFQMSTARLSALSQPGESLYGIQFTNGGRIVIFGGGEVLRRGDVILGALGVSGGSAEQDTALAAYGKSVFENMHRPDELRNRK